MHQPYSWIEINQSAIEHNITQYKQVIGSNKLAVVIKGNAYGHGMFEIGRICQVNKHVDWICTVNLSNALALREKGIAKPILVLGCIDEDIALAAHQNINFTIDNLLVAQQLNSIGKQQNYRFQVHLKIDTGLSRNGIFPDQTLSFIKKIQKLSHVQLHGIYSHFAESDNHDQQFTQQQRQQFTDLLQLLSANSVAIPYKHMTNSAAIVALDHSHEYNFFRIGLGIYGLWSSPANKKTTLARYPDFALKPALTWKTRIMRIKTIPADSYVSYKRTHRVEQNTTIAILPIGYYDGYDTRYSNKTSVLINNALAPVIGRVCMNMTIIDITSIPTAQVGDKVTLLGNAPNISAYDLAHAASISNVREVITTINPSISRVVM